MVVVAPSLEVKLPLSLADETVVLEAPLALVIIDAVDDGGGEAVP